LSTSDTTSNDGITFSLCASDLRHSAQENVYA